MRRHVAEIDDVVFLVQRVHQPVVSQLLLAQTGEFGEELIETRGLENHQAARGAAGRQIERVRHAGRNVHAGARLRRHPFAIEMKIHDAVQDIKSLGVLAVQMQAEREFALKVVFHQRIGAAGVGGGDLDVGVVARPVVVASAAGRLEAVALGWHEDLVVARVVAVIPRADFTRRACSTYDERLTRSRTRLSAGQPTRRVRPTATCQRRVNRVSTSQRGCGCGLTSFTRGTAVR